MTPHALDSSYSRPNSKYLQSVNNEVHKYTCELNKEWTPFNSNLHMQGIKVLVNDPVPVTTKNPDSFEDTLLLLDMVKEKKQKDKQSRKESICLDVTTIHYNVTTITSKGSNLLWLNETRAMFLGKI